MSCLRYILIFAVLALFSMPAVASATRQQSPSMPDSIVTTDGSGRVIARSVFSRQNGAMEELRYDMGGEVVSQAKVVSVSDKSGRTTSRAEYILAGGGWRLVRRAVFVYDANGNLTQETVRETRGRQTNTLHSYSPQGRLMSRTMFFWDYDDVDWAPAEKFEYSYSSDPYPAPGRLYALRTHYEWGGDESGWVRKCDTQSIDYDDECRPCLVCFEDSVSPEARCDSYSYDAYGRLTSVVHGHYVGNALSVDSSEVTVYDAAGRVSRRNACGSQGQLAKSYNYYYPDRAKAPRRSPAPLRLDSVVTFAADGETPMRRTSYLYDSRGRLAIERSQAPADGSWADLLVKTYRRDQSGVVNSTVTLRYSSPCPDFEEQAPSAYTVTILDEKGNPVQEYYHSSADTLCGSACFANAYDSHGRLVSSVKTTVSPAGAYEVQDSTSFAYDMPNMFESDASKSDSASANVFSRMWMRLAGFFRSDDAKMSAETDSLPTVDWTSCVERRTSSSAGCVKSLAYYDSDGRLLLEYSYVWSPKGNTWVMAGKNEYKAIEKHLKECRHYNKSASHPDFVLVSLRKFYYY